MAADIAAARRAQRTQRMLSGPIVPTLAALAAPNMVLVTAQVAQYAGEAVWAGRLGTDALAALALVFPIFMLMQTMSAGAMGGAVSAAIARALGAGDAARAARLAGNAVLIALAFALMFVVLFALAAGPVFRLLGGPGPGAEQAAAYARIMFGGAAAFWLANTLASILRGTGTMTLPAAVLTVAALGQVGLAACLMLGLGPFPRIGVAGGGLAAFLTATVAALVMGAWVISGKAGLAISAASFRPAPAQLRDILRVGLPAVANALMTSGTIVLVTAAVARYGPEAMAGYGLGARLEFILIPIIFAFGAALTAMVGTNVGAGRLDRAHRVAWIGAALCAGGTGLVGVAVAIEPALWLDLFTGDSGAREVGAAYLSRVGPAYGAFGLGLALYFASQGAGAMRWPVVAGTTRLVVAAGGGLAAAAWAGASLSTVFLIVALGMLLFGGIIGASVAGGAWRRAQR